MHDDPQLLFQLGVHALRDDGDVTRARELLSESLKLDPKNEKGWLWLSRAYDDNPHRKLYCLTRALSINPDNAQARALHDRLSAQLKAEEAAAAPPKPEPPAPRTREALTARDEERIKILLSRAEAYAEDGEMEKALDQWVDALMIQADHPVAMQHAVRQLSRMGYLDDARELIAQAIAAGTTIPAIYLTGIDIAKRQHNYGEADSLTEAVARLPGADDDLVARAIEHFTSANQAHRALQLLNEAIEKRPNSQKLLLQMAQFQEEIGNRKEAMRYYDRAARAKGHSSLKRQADRALKDYQPVMTDRERGSVLIAAREAAGFGAFYLLLAWQDAGLNLLALGAERWAGVLLSLLGGYLLITATSSPQQSPLAGWFGGSVPLASPAPEPKRGEIETPSAGVVEEPTTLPALAGWLRWMFAVCGLVILALAFVLVFGKSLDLLANPIPPPYPILPE